jgi:hypothetical protein
MKRVAAHFDGKQIVLEEPVKLTAQTKLKVIVAEEGETFSDDDLSRWFLRLSEPAFANVWDNARDAAYDKLTQSRKETRTKCATAAPKKTESWGLRRLFLSLHDSVLP